MNPPESVLVSALRIGVVLAASSLISAIQAGCANQSRYLEKPPQHLHSTQDPAFRQELNSLLGPSLSPGNRVTTLVNGNEIFPEMLRAIRSAKQTITFETYVFKDGEVAKQFARALAERARAGVCVHVILDAQGAQGAGKENLALMKAAGVQVQEYHPLFWWDIRRYNNRTHRKLLIVDGK